MTSEISLINPSIKKWVIIAALLGTTALAFYMFYVVGIDELILVVQQVNPAVYVFAVASLMISLVFHTLVWVQLLNSVGIRLGFWCAHKLYWVGVFVDNLIPGGWSGDFFKAYLINKDPNVESGKSVASIVAKNMYEALFNLANMIIGIGLLILNYKFEGSLLITFGGIMLLLTAPLSVLLVASFKPKGARKIVAALFKLLSSLARGRWNLERLQTKVEKALGDYNQGMKVLLKKPNMLLKPMMFSFVAWIFEIITLVFVFASLGEFIPFDKVIIVRAITGNVEAQGYAFMGYATIVTSELYKALGVPFALGASVALLGGAAMFWLRSGISYTAFHHTVFSNKPLILQPERAR